MLYKKCSCGCGKWFLQKNKNHNWYDNEHRRRYQYAVKTGKIIKQEKEKAKTPEEMTPGERWKAMTLAQAEAECLRYHKSYGKLQAMAENKTLPEDFGLLTLKEETE